MLGWDAYLALTTGGSLGYHGGVRNIVSEVKEGPAAGEVTVVQAYFSGEDLCIGAQQGAITPTLTLDPPAKHVSVNRSKILTYIKSFFFTQTGLYVDMVFMYIIHVLCVVALECKKKLNEKKM